MMTHRKFDATLPPISVYKEQYEELEAEAQRRLASLSQICREAITEYLANHGLTNTQH